MRSSGSKRSFVWNHYSKLSEHTVLCHICDKKLKYSGNTSNLNEHLRRRHVEFTEKDKNEGKLEASIAICSSLNQNENAISGSSTSIINQNHPVISSNIRIFQTETVTNVRYTLLCLSFGSHLYY